MHLHHNSLSELIAPLPVSVTNDWNMKYLCSLAFAMLTCIGVSGQVAVKTNLLYDAVTTPNLGVEVGLGRKSTVNLVYGFNPWSFHSDSKGKRKAKHWVLMPEYRWWTCSKFNGHFFGVHAMGGEFNAANVSLHIPGFFFSGDNLTSEVKDSRYQAVYAGAGFTYGYQWILDSHWNIEAEIGVGYNHVWYDKYRCGDCGGKLKDGQTNYAGVTKIGLSIMYIF